MTDVIDIPDAPDDIIERAAGEQRAPLPHAAGQVVESLCDGLAGHGQRLRQQADRGVLASLHCILDLDAFALRFR
jgi:hypothetical protein